MHTRYRKEQHQSASVTQFKNKSQWGRIDQSGCTLCWCQRHGLQCTTCPKSGAILLRFLKPTFYLCFTMLRFCFGLQLCHVSLEQLILIKMLYNYYSNIINSLQRFRCGSTPPSLNPPLSIPLFLHSKQIGSSYKQILGMLKPLYIQHREEGTSECSQS